MPSRSLAAATDNPAKLLRANTDRRIFVPDIVEWVTSDRYLNRPNIYPRQLTFLKVIFLQDELFTPYDYDVLYEWANGFRPPPPPGEGDFSVRWQGDWGIVPDVLDRIKYLKANGHHWFRVVLAIMGRRSGKGYIGGIAGSYVLAHYIHMADPKSAYGVDADKRLSCQVFAGKRAQARDNQWRDLVSVIQGSPFLQSYISNSNTETLTLFTPRDFDRATLMRAQGVHSEIDIASMEIVPKEATTMAARGPASFMQFYDEGAHMQATGQSRSMEEVWETATPALDQFKRDAFIYSGSSPWSMSGKFYDLAQQTLEVDAETFDPMYPENLLVQLASWDIYKDWEQTKKRMVAAPARRVPGEIGSTGVVYRDVPVTYFRPLRQAIQVFDEAMQRLERANPETFRVERRSKWATALDAYFSAEMVDQMFSPWQGVLLENRTAPERMKVEYIAHGDPGKTGSNFGFAIAHLEPDPNGDPIPHVVFDYIKAWTPGDFDSLTMEYPTIRQELKDLMDAYQGFRLLTFDQWNSLSMIQDLQIYARDRYYKRVSIEERDATAKLNWVTAETTKMALYLGKVHAPYHELAELEFKFLQKNPHADKVDHPDTGPVTTKDVYDAMSIVIYHGIGQQIAAAYGDQFSKLRIASAMPGPSNPSAGPSPGAVSSVGLGGQTDVAALFSRYAQGRLRQHVGPANPARNGPRQSPKRKFP